MNDDQLLAAVGEGDRQAFARLYDHWARPVFGIVRKVVRDPARSEAVAQEVFLEIWRKGRSFDPLRGAAATWIMTMAHRRAIDRVRSVQASRGRTERVGLRDMVTPFDQTADVVIQQGEHEQVRVALADLTPVQREAIALAFYGGHTYREVSELLATPLGTVKTRIRDGLIRLRDSLGSTT